MNIKIFVVLLAIASTAMGFDNDTMTPGYKSLVQDKEPLNAALSAYTTTMGDWFYLILIGAPYVMLWLHQRSMHIPTIWLTCCLAAYGSLLYGIEGSQTTTTYPTHIFWGILILWTMSILMKLLSPIYKK